MTSTGDRRHCWALFVAGCVVLATGAGWGVPPGKSVVGARVILDGGLPYRDFWTMYAPGQFYAVAALFRVFGAEVLVQALAVAVIRAGSAVALFVLLRRLGATRGASLGLAAVFVFMFWTTGPELIAYPPALLFVLLALDRVVGYFSDGAVRQLRWAGGWLGLAACFKHDVAAYVAIGTAIALFLSWVIDPSARPAEWVAPLRATRAVALAALAAAAPLAVWTVWSAGPEAWDQLFVFPATVFPQVRGDRFPPLLPVGAPVGAWLSDPTSLPAFRSAITFLSTWVVLRAPPLIFLAGVGAALWSGPRLDARSRARLLLCVASMPFFWAAAHVQQNTHPYTLSIVGAGAGVVLWSRVSGRPAWRARLRLPLTVAVGAYAAALLSAPVVSAARVVSGWQGSQVIDLPGVRGLRLPPRLYGAYESVGRFIRTHTKEGEPIYAGLVRHDAIVINDPMLYAFAGRPACCGYTELHPGVGDRAEVQREIISALEARGVRAIVLWDFGWPAADLEARKRRAKAAVSDAGSTLLDHYIAEHFRHLETHGELRVLWRRDAPPPRRHRSTSG